MRVVTRYRALRRFCGIPAKRIAEAAYITPQRLLQIECGDIRSAESCILAARTLETIIDRQIVRLVKAKAFLVDKESKLFDMIEEGELFE